MHAARTLTAQQMPAPHPPQLSDAKDYPIPKHALGRSLVTIRRARPVKKFLGPVNLGASQSSHLEYF